VSSFQGSTTNTLGGVLLPTDERAVQSYHQWNGHGRQSIVLEPWMEGLGWTWSTGLGGQIGSVGPGLDASSDAGYWNPFDSEACGITGRDEAGNSAQNIFVGQTLNSTGSPLPNCKVTGFVTATNACIGSVTSDANGYYCLPTPYGTSVAHYVVAFLAGNPDVAGMSDNTLTPSVP